MKFYVPLTATEASLADGSALIPGSSVNLNKEQAEENSSLIESGQLHPTGSVSTQTAEDVKERGDGQ